MIHWFERVVGNNSLYGDSFFFFFLFLFSFIAVDDGLFFCAPKNSLFLLPFWFYAVVAALDVLVVI